MSTWCNYDEVISTLISHDFVISNLDIGVMRRIKREGHKQKGWYVVHEITLEDGRHALIGSFGYWFGGDAFIEKIAPGADVKLSKEQLEAIKKQHADAQKRAKLQREQDAKKASHMATVAWYKYLQEGESSYLNRKVVRAHGLRFSPSGNGTVAIPMKDTKGKIWGLQIIRGKDRGNKLEKEYWPKGLNKKAHFHLCGSVTSLTPTILIAEGYATGASIYQATDLPVAIAFDAGNLIEVASALHKEYPRARILICADDDYLQKCVSCKQYTHIDHSKNCEHCGNIHGAKNAGVSSAESAALAVGGAWIKPEFPFDREGKNLTDFNDLVNFPNCSESTIRVQITDKLNQLGWVLGVPRARSIQQGGGVSDIRSSLKPLLDVTEAVERYSLIYGAGGTMYDHQESSLIPKSDVLDICVDHAWREWKLHPMRKVVRLSEVGFDPTEKDRNILCNLWGGWPTEPKKGQCGILLSLLEHLCSGEESGNNDIYQWVLKWLAYPIQNKGAKMRTALIFHGPQGAGKNLFFEAYAQLFGKYSRIVGQAEIDDKFNDWASGKLFMIADEVVARQELFHIKNKIKALITGDTIRINPKNVAAHDEKNHVNIVFLSNEKQPLVLEKDDRRFAVIWTPEKLHPNYYSDVAEEVKEGGIEALHDYLLQLPLGDFNEHTKPPMTKSKQDLIDINLESGERFLQEWILNELDLPVCPCLSEDLYKAYTDWAKRNGVIRPRELNQIIGNIVKTHGWSRSKPRIFSDYHFVGEAKQRAVIFPPAEFFTEKHIKTADLTEAQWVTTCVLDFKEALRPQNDN